MCRDMVSRKPIPLMCMRSHHWVNLLYLLSIPLGAFGTIIGSTYWILWRNFCLSNVAHWVHICPRPSQHLLVELGDYERCCYQPYVVFNLLVVRWCAGIALRYQSSLHHRRCNVSYFPPPVVWGSWIIHHDVRVLFFNKVPHIVVEETNLGHLECWSLWDLNEKFISVLTVISH